MVLYTMAKRNFGLADPSTPAGVSDFFKSRLALLGCRVNHEQLTRFMIFRTVAAAAT